MIDSGLVGTSLGGVPREQRMLKEHLHRVISDRVYSNIRRSHLLALAQEETDKRKSVLVYRFTFLRFYASEPVYALRFNHIP